MTVDEGGAGRPLAALNSEEVALMGIDQALPVRWEAGEAEAPAGEHCKASGFEPYG